MSPAKLMLLSFLVLSYSSDVYAQSPVSVFAKTCPTISSKEAYYVEEWKKFGVTIDNGMEIQNMNPRPSNYFAVLCGVLEDQVTLFTKMKDDVALCSGPDVNNFVQNFSAQIRIAQQQRQGLNCR